MQMAEKEGKQGREEGVGSSRIRITLTCQEVKPLEKGMPKPCICGPTLRDKSRNVASFNVDKYDARRHVGLIICEQRLKQQHALVCSDGGLACAGQER